jgi:hypothetical protein
LPTTLLVGRSQFDVAAQGNILLGPTMNVNLTMVIDVMYVWCWCVVKGVDNNYPLMRYVALLNNFF